MRLWFGFYYFFVLFQKNSCWIALNLLWNCSGNVWSCLKSLWFCSEFKVLRDCFEDFWSGNGNVPETAPKLLLGCSKTDLKLLWLFWNILFQILWNCFGINPKLMSLFSKPWTEITLKLGTARNATRCNCTEIALKLLWNCSEIALKLGTSCNWKVFHSFSEVALKLLWKCSDNALKVLW